MKPHAQKAEVLRLLLVYSCISIGDIIAWADTKIVEDANPSSELIEVSITEPDKRAAMLSNLSLLAEGCDKFAALRTALGRMYEFASKMPQEELLQFVYALSNIGPDYKYKLPSDLSFLICVDDDFALAANKASSDLPSLSKAFLDNLKNLSDIATT